MALSDTFYSNDTSSYPYLRVYWYAAQKKEELASTVNVYVYLVYTSINLDGGNTCHFTFDGETQSAPFDGINDSTTHVKQKLIATFTKTVQHSENSGYLSTMKVNAVTRNAVPLAYAEAVVMIDPIYRASVINSVSDIYADSGTVTINYNITVAASGFTHKLELLDGSTPVLSFSNITGFSAGTYTAQRVLSADERAALLSYMANMKSFTGTLKLTTYVNGENIGSTSKSVTVATRESVSAPEISGFTFADVNSYTVNITGNNQVLIQGYSKLRITCGTITVKNGASFKSVSAICGDKTKTVYNQGSYIDLNEINTSGELTITVTVTDSRGYTATIAQKVTVTPYEKPKLTAFSLKRQNGVGSIMQLSFSGQISGILVGGANKNSVADIAYRYKKTSDSSYAAWVSLKAASTISGNSFSYASVQAFELDAANSWDVQFLIQDVISPYTYDFVVPQGTPFGEISREAFKINADVWMNGIPVLGRKTKTVFDFHQLTEQGIYYFDRAASAALYSDVHAPPEPYDANVIVLNPSGNCVTILYFGMGFYIKQGRYSNSAWSWGDWYTVTDLI